MTRRDELLALADRCERGEGAGEINELVMAACFLPGKQQIGMQEQDENGVWRNVASDVWLDPQTGKVVCMGAFLFYTSVDAQERLGVRIASVDWIDDGTPPTCAAATRISLGLAPTEARARLAAILRAKAERAA